MEGDDNTYTLKIKPGADSEAPADTVYSAEVAGADTKYTWTIADAPVGEYDVTETGADSIEGYTWQESGSTTKVENVEVTAPTNDGTDTPATADLINVYEEAGSGTLKIVKSVFGSANMPSDVEFTISGPEGFEDVVVKLSEFEKQEDGSYIYTYPDTLPAGKYTVTENSASAQVPGYDLHILGMNNVAQPLTEKGVTFAIENAYNKNQGYVPEELNGEDHYAYLIGYPDGLVQPNWNITRAEVATIFFRLLTDEVREANLCHTNTFGDVDSTMWFNTTVSTMANMGIVVGYPDGDFHPDANITRAEFAAIAARFDKEAKDSANIFTDIDGHWAKSYILRAVNRGWINGYPDHTFRPDRLATRAEVAAMINRVLIRDPETPEDLLDYMIKWPDNMDTSKWYYIDIQEATNSHEYERVTKPTEKWTVLEEAPDWTQYNY